MTPQSFVHLFFSEKLHCLPLFVLPFSTLIFCDLTALHYNVLDVKAIVSQLISHASSIFCKCDFLSQMKQSKNAERIL